MAPTRRILILGGTGEGNRLAAALVDRPDIAAISSLAGRTAEPVLPPGEVRIGGFGGTEGLAEFLRERSIEALVDATHPFARRISANAAQACARTGIPGAVYSRPPWPQEAGDIWLDAADMEEAAEMASERGGTVLLTIGRQELQPFERARSGRFLVRAIEAPHPLPALPGLQMLLARGPFGLDQERRLLRDEGVTLVVTKNSGGAATHAKLQAARELGIPVVMVRRPAPSGLPVMHGIDELLAWLDHALAP